MENRTYREYKADYKRDEKFINEMTSLLNDSDSIKEEEKDIKKRREYHTRGIVLMVINIILSSIILSLFLQFTKIEDKSYLGVIVWFSFSTLFILVYFFMKRRMRIKGSGYSTHLTEQICKCIYSKDAVYAPNGGYSAQFLSDIDAFQVGDLDEEDLIVGKYKGVECSICDVTSIVTETEDISFKNKGKKMFMGSIATFKMNKRVKHALWVDSSANSSEGIQFEGTEFNEQFQVRCIDREEAFYIITPQMQEAFLNLKREFGFGCLFKFIDDELYVILKGVRTDVEHLKLGGKTNKNINKIADEVLIMAYLIDVLNLDHRFNISSGDEDERI